MPSVVPRPVPARVPNGHHRETTRRRQLTGGAYLDNHASTPCDPRVVEEMLPYFYEECANPASSMHADGRKAARAVETGRQQVAASIGAEPSEVIFTSGATESNNLAILGTVGASSCGRRRILAGAIEHKSVLVPCWSLRNQGYDVEIIPVAGDGQIDLDALADMLDKDTFLVTVQAVNNEIGTIQPVSEVCDLVHASGALLHCDAAQALGRIEIHVGKWGVDLLSLSGHKCYGPKGIGALYVRGGARSAPLQSLVHGGGQEFDVRSGTLNVPGIVGVGAAAEFAERERQSDSRRIGRLRDRFERQVISGIPAARRNGAYATRVAGNSSLTLPGIEAEALIARLGDVQCSTGAACTAGALEPSHVLSAVGLTRAEAYSTVRVGIGRFNTQDEVSYAASRLVRTAECLSRVSAPSKTRLPSEQTVGKAPTLHGSIGRGI